jgi:hypothetical protein
MMLLPLNALAIASVAVLIQATSPRSVESDATPLPTEAPGVAIPAPVAQPARTPRPLAADEERGRVLNRNEAYNVARAAEGRVGARVGDDMSYRITGR